MPYLGTFGLEFENTIVIFEMCTLEFVQVKNFAKKTKMPKFGTKMPYLGTFGLEFEKAIVISDISTLEFL